MPGKHWTNREDWYLKRFYPTKGPHYCASRLEGRSPTAVQARAYRLGIQSGMPSGYVPIWWIAPRNARSKAIRTAALRHAQNDGVLRHLPGRTVKNIVPAWWADQYAERERQRNELEARTRSWLQSIDIARMAGVSDRSVRENVRRGYSLGRYLRDAEHVLIDVPRTHYRWHPQQARMAINAWRASRRAA